MQPTLILNNDLHKSRLVYQRPVVDSVVTNKLDKLRFEKFLMERTDSIPKSLRFHSSLSLRLGVHHTFLFILNNTCT